MYSCELGLLPPCNPAFCVA